ncbi:Hypothetical protein CpCP13_1181 [Corynebacterium pseudotuberculosis]|nr:Hypothetical protein Cp4202_1138 [Corynebacterium pseudotuberculosis 42/02-A]AER69198.1 Hypothetical protein Cp106_1129 [Corynebacterium pseudotuberculosis 1/06-A]AFH52098.1 Hypothetical protein Cp267_1199 [Corynebacterium pseudotuberculosis 267]AJC13891.1 hypothetical protein CpVD57_1175 [Corynebacterium pseudotuberculosis]AKJ55830.1 Hypothetical protein Cp12C_1214 [Corynebacterium pseudotuberculosis]
MAQRLQQKNAYTCTKGESLKNYVPKNGTGHNNVTFL